MELTRKHLIISAIVVGSAMLYRFFPSHVPMDRILASGMFLVLLPYLCTTLVLRESPQSYGLTWGDRQKGVLWTVLSLITSLTIFLLLLQFTEIRRVYVLSYTLVQYPLLFVLYGCVVACVTMCYEFFLRGIVINGLRNTLGVAVVGVQLVPMIIMFDLNVTTITLFLIAPFAGFTAYYSRSIYYSAIVSVVFALATDIIMAFVLY